MATTNFHARIERIQKAHASVAVAAPKSVRASGIAGIAASHRIKRRNPLREHLTSISLGLVLGALAAVAQIGLGSDTATWGTGVSCGRSTTPKPRSAIRLPSPRTRATRS